MKLSGMGSFLTLLYDDKFDIYRTDKDLNEDESTNIFYESEPKYTDIPGRLSFSSDDTGADSEVDETPIRYNPKLFCAHDVDVRAGDYIVLRRYSDDGKIIHTYKGVAAQPSWYSTHQEIFIRVDEEA